MRYVIAFGGNLGDVPQTFIEAFKLIEERISPILKISNIYYSKPLPLINGLKQGIFLNGAFLLESELSPDELLKELLDIELVLGRDRSNSIHWGPRVIDLDIICAENLVCHSDSLDIPHPRLHERDFVLIPLKELWPEWVHPEKNKNIEELYTMLSSTERYIEGTYKEVKNFSNERK